MVIKSRIIEVQHEANIASVQRHATRVAQEFGFDPVATGEISIAVTELATNILKHGRRNGRIITSVIKEEDRTGIEITSIDLGPGITNVDIAIEDGYSTLGTMGTGLGAVDRLMDEFHIWTNCNESASNKQQHSCTRIIARKWLAKSPGTDDFDKNGLQFGVMTRPLSGEKYSGDAYFIKRYCNTHIISLIDGLGHGEKAHFAAQTAIRYIGDNYKKSFKKIFQGVHCVCRATRGVAMSISRIDLDNKTLSYAGIGNVVSRIFNSPTPINPINFNGILGLVMRNVHVFSYQWGGGVLVMYTDGISSRWNSHDLPGMKSKTANEIAIEILDRFGRNNDDATVIVGK